MKKIEKNKGISLTGFVVGIALIVILLLLILVLIEKSEITRNAQKGAKEEYSITDTINEQEDNVIEKYILGKDLTGRNSEEIFDIVNEKFIDDNETIQDASETIVYLFKDMDDKDNNIIYFSYKDIIYKYSIVYMENGTNITSEFKEVYIKEETRVGSYVEYDKKKWMILYDDEINGLQMISLDTLKYNGRGFYLGSNDSLIKDWNEVVEKVDLDSDKRLTNFEKAIYSYNNAIETLNRACKELVTINGNIIDVRCVGSDPINKSKENEILYTSENLSKWPIYDSILDVGIGDNIANGIDLNYICDFERMVALQINKIDEVYWMASRTINEGENFICFSVRLVSDEGESDLDYLCHVYKSIADDEYYHARGLRPVVLLREDIEFTSGDGTFENPYTF